MARSPRRSVKFVLTMRHRASKSQRRAKKREARTRERRASGRQQKVQKKNHATAMSHIDRVSIRGESSAPRDQTPMMFIRKAQNAIAGTLCQGFNRETARPLKSFTFSTMPGRNRKKT